MLVLIYNEYINKIERYNRNLGDPMPYVNNKYLTLNEFKKEGFKLDIKTANYFVSYVGKNIDIIISEINKMIIYKQK